MAAKHLKRNSHNVSKGFWWYEDNGGIECVMEYYDEKGVYIGTKMARIPWRSIRAALARKDK